MAYRESQLDYRNTQWFENDRTVNSLKRIKISNGNIRGIFPSEICFNYPISVIVGENGSGKSTILSLASCAFHNETKFCPQNLNRPSAQKERNYYTYKDFFTFAPNEEGIFGVQIQAEYLCELGIKNDIRKKKASGKWNDYNRRPKRVVTFLGINRIVPPSESNPHRNYCKKFQARNELSALQTTKLREAMSKIFAKNYSNVDILGYGAYHLFAAQRNGTGYTGFNMGAGENAALGLLYEIMLAGRGALIVVDEIELGLHAKAQGELVNVLKEFCNEYHCQIICSTHSKMILDAVPPKARIFIKQQNNGTEIIPEISSEYAFGRLSGITGKELSIFVEDKVGKAIIQNIIPQNIRERVTIFPIGSDQAILRQMAAHYRERDYNFIAFLDGDKQNEKNSEIEKIKAALESCFDHTKEDFEQLFEKRLQFLPGQTWPEKYLVETIIRNDNYELLGQQWGMPAEDLAAVFENALNVGKHQEFYSIAKEISIEEVEQVRADMIRQFKQMCCEECSTMIRLISEMLE